MELRHLRYFITVAEELHFARAAERLQIAQQPLSVQIRHLEEEIGVTLFERTTRRVSLTDAGRIFLVKAYETIAAADQAIQAAQEAERGERGEIRLGYVSTSLYNHMPPLIRAFRERFPHVRVILRELCPPDLDRQIVQGQLDIGLTGTPLYPDELNHLCLGHEPVVVVMSDRHHLASHTEIRLRDLDGEPFIQYDSSKHQVHQEIERIFYNAGIRLNDVQEASSEQAMIGLAAAGMGVSVVAASLSGIRQKEVVYRRLIEPEYEVDFNLIWRHEPSPVVKSFIQMALEYVAATDFVTA